MPQYCHCHAARGTSSVTARAGSPAIGRGHVAGGPTNNGCTRRRRSLRVDRGTRTTLIDHSIRPPIHVDLDRALHPARAWRSQTRRVAPRSTRTPSIAGSHQSSARVTLSDCPVRGDGGCGASGRSNTRRISRSGDMQRALDRTGGRSGSRGRSTRGNRSSPTQTTHTYGMPPLEMAPSTQRMIGTAPRAAHLERAALRSTGRNQVERGNLARPQSAAVRSPAQRR